MLSSNSGDGWNASPFVAIILVSVVAFIIYRNRVRHRSLHRREDGIYVWTEWHRGERTSLKDPSGPGGDWDSDSGGDGGD